MSEYIFKLSDGELELWIEQNQSLCIKAITEYGDPVELSCDEARILLSKLKEFVDIIDN